MEEIDDDTAKVLEVYAICKDLGWDVAINDSEEYVHGMVIGTKPFIKSIFNGEVDVEGYDLYSVSAEEDGDMH